MSLTVETKKAIYNMLMQGIPLFAYSFSRGDAIAELVDKIDKIVEVEMPQCFPSGKPMLQQYDYKSECILPRWDYERQRQSVGDEMVTERVFKRMFGESFVNIMAGLKAPGYVLVLPIEKKIDASKAAFTGRLEVHMLPERKGADGK